MPPKSSKTSTLTPRGELQPLIQPNSAPTTRSTAPAAAVNQAKATAADASATTGPAASRYKYGDGADTDDFLQGITGAKPRSRPPPKYEPSVDTESAVSSTYYSPNRGEKKAADVCGVKDCRSRALTVFVAIVLVGGGAALIALLNHSAGYLKDLWPLAYFVANVVGALYILGGLIGVFSAVSNKDLHRRAALLVYAVGLIGVIIGFTLATLVRSGKQDDKLLAGWETMTTQDATRACSIQHDLNCTGWTVACAATIPETLAPQPPPPTATTTTTAVPSPTNAPSGSASSAAADSVIDIAATPSRLDVEDSASPPQLFAFGLKKHELLESLESLLALLGNSSGVPNQCVEGCVLEPYHNYNQTCGAALQARVAHDYPIAVAVFVFCVLWTFAFGVLVSLKREMPTGYGTIQA